MGGCCPKEQDNSTDLRQSKKPQPQSQGQPASAQQTAPRSNKSTEVPTSTEIASKKKAKVIFMGNANVGKTSIINSFIRKKSMKGEPKTATKVGDDFLHVLTVKDSAGMTHELTLSIWDAAGDAAVHNVAHMFCEGAKVAVLCYAIDDQRSYQQLTDWADHIREQEDLFSVVLGNKDDLSDNRDVPMNYCKKLQREVRNCKIAMETSAFENVEAIQELFQQIGEIIVNENYYVQA